MSTAEKEALKSLAELQAANLPRCDWRALLEVTGEMTPDDEAAMDAHFRRFLQPGPCVKCGERQGGDMVEAALGITRFRWGIANGEGACSTPYCGYPARAYHRHIGPIKFLNMILQYHPDELRAPAPEAEGGQ